MGTDLTFMGIRFEQSEFFMLFCFVCLLFFFLLFLSASIAVPGDNRTAINMLSLTRYCDPTPSRSPSPCLSLSLSLSLKKKKKIQET